MEAMTGKNKKERGALDRLADALVDDILNTSDEDILTEFKETHGDPAQNAVAMRTLFEKTVIAMNKQRLADAKAGVAAARRWTAPASMKPIDIMEARRQLRRVLDTPANNQPVTIAARNETELSDADVLGMLDDLKELGIIPPDHEKDG
jgi:hypothetical protein